MKRILQCMNELFKGTVVSEFCKQKDKGGNSVLHLAVRKSLTELMSSMLSIPHEADQLFNQDGHNPLHLAAQTTSTRMVTCILERGEFDVNVRMLNGETVLHMVAQLGDSSTLAYLIKHGGDLSIKDLEDKHTPLHDCLQQVYFESINTEEKCDKFIEIWNTVVEKAVRWWVREKQEEPANGSKEYLKVQRKAIYYLRSCIKNKYGLSVLQFAADRGLVMCVQTMLSTKGVFVTETMERTKKGKLEKVYEIDVTNLCPEYSVEEKVMYGQDVLNMQDEENQGEKNQGEENQG